MVSGQDINVYGNDGCKHWQAISFSFWIKAEPAVRLKKHYERCTICQKKFNSFKKQNLKVSRFVPNNVPEEMIIDLMKNESRDLILRVFDKDIKGRISRIDYSFGKIKRFIFSLAG